MTEFNIEKYLDSLPEDITELNVSGKNLTYLPDLSRFKNLQELCCASNNLTYLPKLNENLKHLSCSDNKLISLPKFNERLEKVWCRHNKLTLLPELNKELIYMNWDNNDLLKIYYNCWSFNEINIITKQFIKCRFRIMCFKYKQHFRRWLWERVRLPKIQNKYHPNNLLESLNNMKNEEDEEEFMRVIETW